jgi:hypothetical protein
MDVIHLPSAIISIGIVLFIVLLRIFILDRIGKNQKAEASYSMHKVARKKLFYEDLKKKELVYYKKKDFYSSSPDNWQSALGYCSLYDDAAPFLGIIVDSEPIAFNYENKKWLIQFWKGQYGISTGFEVGIFTSDREEIIIPETFTGHFYEHAENSSCFHINTAIYKNGSLLIEHQGMRSYLNGYRPGIFSYPEELALFISITFPTISMTKAFVAGLLTTGYESHEIHTLGKTAAFTFSIPKTPQPLTKTSITTYLVQKHNRRLCASYQFLTLYDKHAYDKFYNIRSSNPDIYAELLQMGRKIALYESYDTLKKYL